MNRRSFLSSSLRSAALAMTASLAGVLAFFPEKGRASVRLPASKKLRWRLTPCDPVLPSFRAIDQDGPQRTPWSEDLSSRKPGVNYFKADHHLGESSLQRSGFKKIFLNSEDVTDVGFECRVDEGWVRCYVRDQRCAGRSFVKSVDATGQLSPVEVVRYGKITLS